MRRTPPVPKRETDWAVFGGRIRAHSCGAAARRVRNQTRDREGRQGPGWAAPLMPGCGARSERGSFQSVVDLQAAINMCSTRPQSSANTCRGHPDG
jgi:hypothetical protein